MGESTHGSSEFYRMRARLSQALIERGGFDFVAVEADWPDAMRINHYVLGDRLESKLDFTPFARFPTWMWRRELIAPDKLCLIFEYIFDMLKGSQWRVWEICRVASSLFLGVRKKLLSDDCQTNASVQVVSAN
jgi:hypothetical protein